MIRVIIVDDHQIFVDGVRALLESLEGIKVVGEANNGLDLIDVVSKIEADVVLMDVNMPKMDGIEATKYLNEHFPMTKVLMLTMHDQANMIEKLLEAGAKGYILKNTGKKELNEAIHALFNGESYYSAAVTQKIMASLQQKSKAEKNLQKAELSERELEVLKLIAQEFTSNEIADKLFISHHTVESHRKNLISKLQVRGAMGLVRYAIENNLLDE